MIHRFQNATLVFERRVQVPHFGHVGLFCFGQSLNGVQVRTLALLLLFDQHFLALNRAPEPCLAVFQFVHALFCTGNIRTDSAQSTGKALGRSHHAVELVADIRERITHLADLGHNLANSTGNRGADTCHPLGNALAFYGKFKKGFSER